nr:zinc finger, CCHC-type [Tanacetum cinerariifolium]
MTTSIVNNSVFRGFFEKQKLAGPNFIDWYRQLRIILSVEDKLNYLEHPIPAAHVLAHAGQQVAPEALAAHAAWAKRSKEFAGLMLMTMDSEIQRNLENLEFHSCKQEEGRSISSYVLRMKSYIDNLEHLGNPVTLGLGVSLILISLRKEFNGFMQNYNMHSMGKTINELHAMLKLHEQTLTKNNAPALHAIRSGKVQKRNKKHKKPQPQLAARGQNQGKRKNKLAYAPKPKIPPPPKREDPAKDSICHQCGETGIFTIELYTFPNKSWVYDTGCGTHICNTTQGLKGSRKLKLGALSVGIISVSRLYDDGYVNRFVDKSIQVSRNKMVYFSAIPRDGFFEIDLYDSYTNVSSMYALSNKRAKSNLDFALLWQCRLEHISKKRIEKLQQDGLLNSTDLRAFEKCIPCMSGKMERKPYSHQVERAKHLLGLIHTDVEKTPYKVWHRQAPKLSYLKVWGCEAFVKRDTLTKPDKLEPRSIKCIFIGYPQEIMGYYFYYPPKNKLLVAQNAEFLENSLITQEASESLKDLEIIQEEDTHPSIYTSLNHEEDGPEINEPQSDIISIRRSTRTRHAPDRMCLYIDDEEHKLGDLGEHANYKAALLDLEFDNWLNAMNVKWLFKKKTDIDGAVHTYKAHLVAKGYTQTPRNDYEETFSPVADIRAIRILIAITAFYDYEI